MEFGRRLELSHQEGRHAAKVHDALEREGEVVVDVDAGDDGPSRDGAAVAGDEGFDVLVDEFAEGLVVVLPDEEPIGNRAAAEVDEGAGVDGDLRGADGPFNPLVGLGDVVLAFNGLHVDPAHGDVEKLGGLGAGMGEGLGEIDRGDGDAHLGEGAKHDAGGFGGFGDTVGHGPLGRDGAGGSLLGLSEVAAGEAALELAVGLDEGELLTRVEGEGEALAGEHIGLGIERAGPVLARAGLGMVALLDEGLREGGLGALELAHRGVVGGQVEEPPLLEFVEDEHQLVAGEFEEEEVGLLAVGEEAGFEVEGAEALGLAAAEREVDAGGDAEPCGGLDGFGGDDLGVFEGDLGLDRDVVGAEEVRLLDPPRVGLPGLVENGEPEHPAGVLWSRGGRRGPDRRADASPALLARASTLGAVHVAAPGRSLEPIDEPRARARDDSHPAFGSRNRGLRAFGATDGPRVLAPAARPGELAMVRGGTVERTLVCLCASWLATIARAKDGQVKEPNMRRLLCVVFGTSLSAAAFGQCDLQWLGTLGTGTDGPIFALTEWRGELVAGGSFLHAGGIEAARVARWDGSAWQALGSGVDGTVYGACEFAGDLVVAGNLTLAGGVKANSIARWDGSTWHALGDGLYGSIAPGTPMVTALAAHDGSVFAVGGFDTAGGEEALSGARWDGRVWHAAPLRANKSSLYAYYHLRRIGVSLCAGGGLLGGVFVRKDGEWLPLGLDSSFYMTIPIPIDGQLAAVWSASGPNAVVKGLSVFENGAWSKIGYYGSGGINTLMVATAATTFGGDLYLANTFPIYPTGQYAARYRDGFHPLGTGLVPSGQSTTIVGAMLPYRGRLVVAGAFAAAGGVPANNIAVWGCECPADCDGSGLLDIDDFLCFQTRYALGEFAADCDNNTLLDIDDFVCFQTLFAVGC